MYTMAWQDGKLSLIDQTLLPGEVVYRDYTTVEGVHDAIRDMVVRGAPAIGVAAAYGMVLAANAAPEDGFAAFVKEKGEYLIGARPTAVNLEWAVRRMLNALDAGNGQTPAACRKALEELAVAMHKEDIAVNRAIGENLLSLLKPGDGVLTHCNAGALATTEYGTALSPFYLALERGDFPLRVYADETRPRQQGARLTSFELFEAGADVTLICDDMAAVVMREGKINACIVGCDRVAANGDTANKIGTFTVGILAKHFGIPLYIAAPTSTIDLACPDGAHIPIEERDGDEVRRINGGLICPAEVKVYNPAFDVTPAELIAAIVTERGIARAPFTESLKGLLGGK